MIRGRCSDVKWTRILECSPFTKTVPMTQLCPRIGRTFEAALSPYLDGRSPRGRLRLS